jgi:Protein of unknown function (DUF1501)
MDPFNEMRALSRRHFLTSTSCGVGFAALAAMFQADGLLASEVAARKDDPLRLKGAEFPARAKRCICIFLEGGPSQMDLFDPKPELARLDGQKMPESLTKNVRFAFIQKETATIMASKRKFSKHGQCGTEISDLLPHIAPCADDIAVIRTMHTEAFNHHPAQLMMNSGVPRFGRPSMGAWLNYGLGSESNNLPGYVVLTAGRGTSGGASNWTSGFLPSSYAGVVFRSKGDPVLDLANPPGVSTSMQSRTVETISNINRAHYELVTDHEINSRISAYELAFRMQTAAPKLIDFADETPATLAEYGVDRVDPVIKSDRSGGPNQYHSFATNCLLARRLVERGVRFVNIYHGSWDHHSNLDVELPFNCRMVDQPIAALINDLKQRGLLDDTLVIWCSEFGRTPLGENRPGYKQVTGRDHHPSAFSLWLAGGGVKGGQVIGRTDDIGWGIVDEPVHVNDFHATILRLFGINHLNLKMRFNGLDVRLTNLGGKVVDKLLA